MHISSCQFLEMKQIVSHGQQFMWNVQIFVVSVAFKVLKYYSPENFIFKDIFQASTKREQEQNYMLLSHRIIVI